jgi:hypothetical protein
MSTGIQLFNANQKKFFDTESQTWNYVGSFIAPANGSATATYSTMSLMSEFIFQRSAVDNPPANQEGYIHDVSRSGNDVTASGGSIRTLVIVLGR